jgi:hypothetical protein
MVFNTTFNNISAISWHSALLVEQTRAPRENHRPVTSHWQTLSHNAVIRAWNQHCLSGIFFNLSSNFLQESYCIVYVLERTSSHQQFVFAFNHIFLTFFFRFKLYSNIMIRPICAFGCIVYFQPISRDRMVVTMQYDSCRKLELKLKKIPERQCWFQARIASTALFSQELTLCNMTPVE